MHLGIFSVALLCSSVFALPIDKQLASRDLTVIDKYFKSISSDLNMIKSTIKGLPNGGSESIANIHAKRLLDQYTQLNHDIKEGSLAVKKGPGVFTLELVPLTTSLTSFSSLTTDVVNGMMSENTKRMIWTAGKKQAQDRFAQELANASGTVTSFGDAIISKLPILEQGIANWAKSIFLGIMEPSVRVSLPSIGDKSKD
jgi:hypothetical protein